MDIIDKNISEIIPYANNPRKNDDSVDRVANSIKEFDWQVPIVIDKNNVIIAGHTRYKAAQKLGIEKIPCVVAENLTDEQVKAYRLADNKAGESSIWDFSKLSEEIDDICNIDMTEFGFPEFNSIGGGSIQNKEFDIGDFDDEKFSHECPKCGFKFN